ncbi:MAG: hypothetical protein GY950_00785 [bacterium]|nr:hypothetical protein [bacterium]
MPSIEDILGAFGLSADIVEANARAIAEPTSSNIGAVTTAYARNGLAPPGKLMAYLLAENEKRYPHDTVRGSLAPYVLGGAVLLYLIFRK